MSIRSIVFLVLAAFSVLWVAPAYAQSPSDDAARLAGYRHSITTLRDNAERGVITPGQAEEGARRYVEEASATLGRDVAIDEIMAAPPPAYAPAPAQELTALQRFAGLVTFVNVLWVLGIALGVVCFAFLFGSYVVELVKLLKNVPLEFYEVVFYAGSVGLALWGRTLSAGVAPYVGLTGCLLFGAAVLFTARAHEGLKLGGAGASAIMCVAWSIAALAYGSGIIGFIAVAALMSALGFSVVVTPLTYGFGFQDEAAVGRATSAAFAVLIAYVAVRILGSDPSFLGVFETGALFLGSFVGYLGLLIASSRWYDGRGRNYALFQVVTIAAGVGALFVGSVFGIGELQKVGGTFFVLYCVEKILEVPAKSMRGYAAVGLAVSAAVFAFCMYVKSDPGSLRPFLFMP